MIRFLNHSSIRGALLQCRRHSRHVAAATFITGVLVCRTRGFSTSCSVSPAACAAPPGNWALAGEKARALHKVYEHGFAFPDWSIDMLAAGDLEDSARTAVVYYPATANLETIKRLATQREPVNIAMRRLYDETQLQEVFGYTRGAYSDSDSGNLMPNIAIYCKTPIRSPSGQLMHVHVINAVGYAFDSTEQPDYQYFFPLTPDKWTELVMRMQQMWRYIFECAYRNRLKYIYLADVGGGAFSSMLRQEPGISYERLKQMSLPAIQEEYAQRVEVRRLPRIPDWVFTPEGQAQISDSLLVNAWDPWSMVGNGNARDQSLDGYFGRSTALAVLCWPVTNPLIRYESMQ